MSDKNRKEDFAELDHKTQLAIHKEVASIVKERIEEKDREYVRLVTAVLSVFTIAAVIVVWLGYDSLEKSQKAFLNSTAVSDLTKSIQDSATEASNKLASVERILGSVQTNEQRFLDRLNILNARDTVLTKAELSQAFANQPLTNLVDGNRVLLEHDAIPATVRISTYAMPSATPVRTITLEGIGYCESNVVTLTNRTFLGSMSGNFNTNSLRTRYKVEYMRSYPPQPRR